MSGNPGHPGYDDGYGHQQGNTESYYDNEQGQYYDNTAAAGYDAHAAPAAQEGYYDES